MDEEPQEYQSYLLRLWRASSQDKLVWRASLESAQSGIRRSFATLEELFTFLKKQTEGNRDDDDGTDAV